MKKILITTLVLLIPVLLILISGLKLVKTGNRQVSYSLTTEMRNQIDKETRGMTAFEIQIYSIEFTAKHLDFAKRNDISKGKANCVGYAQLCACVFNQALASNKLKGYAKPVVGYVKLGRLNICHVLRNLVTSKYKNFVKDHDFVEFDYEGWIDGPRYADPCAYDLIGNDCMTFALSF